MNSNCNSRVSAPLVFEGAVDAIYDGTKQIKVCIPKLKLQELLSELDSKIEERVLLAIDNSTSTIHEAITNIVNNITNTAVADAIADINNELGKYLLKSGGTMTGDINMGGNNIVNANNITSI